MNPFIVTEEIDTGLGACACGGTCASCASALGALSDFTQSINPQTGEESFEYKSGGIDPATGFKLVFESIGDLFSGKREKDAARQAAERLAKIQAASDVTYAQSRAQAREQWVSLAPMVLLGLGALGVAIVLVKVAGK